MSISAFLNFLQECLFDGMDCDKEDPVIDFCTQYQCKEKLSNGICDEVYIILYLLLVMHIFMKKIM